MSLTGESGIGMQVSRFSRERQDRLTYRCSPFIEELQDGVQQGSEETMIGQKRPWRHFMFRKTEMKDNK